MTPIADGALAELIAGYLDGTLDEAGALTLADLVQSGGAVANRIRALVATAGLVSLSFDPVSAEDLARSVDEHITADAHHSALLRAVSKAIAPGYSWANAWIPVGALVAALLVVVAVLFTTTRQGAPEQAAQAALHQSPSAPVIAVLHGPHQPDRDVHCGDELSLPVGTQALLMIRGEPTTCTLDGADCVVTHGSPGVAVSLHGGAITAEVAHQAPGVQLTIATAQAIATVIGTRFTISADPSRTRLHVLQGVVALQDHQGGTTAVAAGEAVESLIRTAGAPTAPATVLPIAEDWSPLFPGGSLDAWTQQHGAWRSDQGSIIGEDVGGGPARIISTRSLGDFSMACRVRILHINWAEIQLLGYNVFVPVAPSEPGTWQDLEVQVRAGQVRATCNGVAVVVQPGLDLGAVRFGTLSFYVRPGGRLEIRDALFCENPARPLPTR